MRIIIKHNDWTKPVGTHLQPLLNIGYTIEEKDSEVYFNDEKEIKDLYDRYKEGITWDSYGLQDGKDIDKYMITLKEFLHSEHIYILLGCINGDGHEVLYS
jgi:hypothetical protein